MMEVGHTYASVVTQGGIMGDCVGGGCDTVQRLGCLAERRNPQKLQRGLKGFKIYVSRNENVSSSQY